jgi:2'-5' RNA ligase
MLRTFIAANILRTRELASLLDRLQGLGDQFRPVAADHFHVTLKFLGDTAESQIDPISTVMKRVVESRPAFHLTLSGLGAFPNARRPSVVWIGFEPAEPLCQIAGDLEQGLSDLGVQPEDRPFTPHLTLLRIKTRPPEALFRLLAEESETEFGLVKISRVHLFQSELTRAGAKYTQLATAVMRG